MNANRFARPLALAAILTMAMSVVKGAESETPSVSQPVSSPASPLGRTIATQGTAKGIPACIRCHGANGEGNAAAGFPRLAGLSETYLAAQLTAFADGTRENSIMQPFAKIMSLDGREAVAQYFSSLSAPKDIRTHDSADVSTADTGAWLATRGRCQEDLPAGVQCHGPGGVGVGSVFPPLAGQPAAYIAAQLGAWKNGKRAPGPLALMPAIASKLSDADIQAVAQYYAQPANK